MRAGASGDADANADTRGGERPPRRARRARRRGVGRHDDGRRGGHVLRAKMEHHHRGEGVSTTPRGPPRRAPRTRPTSARERECAALEGARAPATRAVREAPARTAPLRIEPMIRRGPAGRAGRITRERPIFSGLPGCCPDRRSSKIEDRGLFFIRLFSKKNFKGERPFQTPRHLGFDRSNLATGDPPIKKTRR